MALTFKHDGGLFYTAAAAAARARVNISASPDCVEMTGKSFI